jgi:hypothetical protein
MSDTNVLPYRPLPVAPREAVFCKRCTHLQWGDGGPRCRAPGDKFDPIHGFSCDPRARNADLDCESFALRLPWWKRLLGRAVNP